MKIKNVFDGEYNCFKIRGLTGKTVDFDYDDIIDTDELYETEGYENEEGFYYQFELITDEDDCFQYVSVQKVGGAENDGPHGTEYYDELTETEVQAITMYMKKLFENEGEI